MNRVKDTDSQNEAITAVRENKNVIIRAKIGRASCRERV